MITDLQTYARKGLEAELVRLDGERERVRTLLASLGGTTSKPPSAPSAGRRRGQMSEAGRQAIREAQKRRWARVRAAQAGSPEGAQNGKAASKSRLGATSTRGRGVRQANATGARKK
jgi:Arc/MetJ-type ribon-helix-helix transcriptional regulator